jgi:excisionase family DNA binding protein
MADMPELSEDTLSPKVEQAVDRLAYSVPEALHALGIGRTAFYAAVDAGTIRTVKVGRRRLVPRSALLELLESPDGAPAA